jgi:hypothetical protein
MARHLRILHRWLMVLDDHGHVSTSRAAADGPRRSAGRDSHESGWLRDEQERSRKFASARVQPNSTAVRSRDFLSVIFESPFLKLF